MEFSIFVILAIIIHIVSLAIAFEKGNTKFQAILVVGLVVLWFILSTIKGIIAQNVAFEELGLVKALLLQIMDKFFFNAIAPITALLFSIFKSAE